MIWPVKSDLKKAEYFFCVFFFSVEKQDAFFYAETLTMGPPKKKVSYQTTLKFEIYVVGIFLMCYHLCRLRLGLSY